jgi:hypothetical protein
MSRVKTKNDPMSDVCTNRIIVDSLDSVAMDTKYDFFQITREDRNWSSFEDMADDILFEKNICAVRYIPFGDEGDASSMFVMMTKSDLNHAFLNEYIRKNEKECRKVKKCTINEMMQDWKKETVQLLLNSTEWMDVEGIRFNNITGRCFCTNRAWFKGKKSFMAIELLLKNEIIDDKKTMVLSPELKTFTRYKDMPDGTHKKPKNELPQFELKDDYSIKRAFKKSDNNYIIRQFRGKKSSLKYIDFKNPRSFYKSKAYILLNAVEKFNLRFKGIMHISFDHWIQVKHESITQKSIKSFNKLLNERMQQREFSIFDLVDDEESRDCLERIIYLFRSEFKIDVKVSNGPVDDCLNLSIIHDEDYYKRHPEIDDHYDFYDDHVVHHVTIEKFMKDTDDEKQTIKTQKTLIKVLVKELFVKEDISNRHITIDGWVRRKYSEDMVFATLFVDKNDKSDYRERTVYKMTVHPDGSFQIESISERGDCKDRVSDALFNTADLIKEANVEGAVMDIHGNINLIGNTKIITVPEKALIEIFKRNEKEGKKSNRTRDDYSKNYIIHGNLDIRALRTGNEMYYFAGDLGDTPQQSTYAPNVRRIIPFENSNIFFDELLELMNVPFVKYNDSTILPYPFKYLNEYVYIADKRKKILEKGNNRSKVET